MATPNVSEILATTLDLRSEGYTETISKTNALLYKLRQRGNIRLFDGGASIRERLLYNTTGTYTRYSGYEFLNVKPSEVFTEAEFPIKLAATSVTISGEELLKNSGDAQLEDLLEGKIEAAEIELENSINEDLHSDGTADGGRQIGGLGLLLSTTPTTGTVAGINRANWSFWRNKAYNSTATFGAAMSAANIISQMDRVVIDMAIGTDGPDLILMGATAYRWYLEAMQAMQRIVSTGDTMAGAGFPSLAYYGAGKTSDVVLVNDTALMAATTMLFLNTKYLRLRIHEDRNFSRFGGRLMPVNQDAIVQHIGFAGNLTTNNPSRQAILTGT